MNDLHNEVRNSREPLLVRVGARVDALPNWLRPVVYGPLLLLFMMGLRGAFIIGPILVAILLLKGDRPLHTLGVGAGILGLLLLASAAGGLMYSVIGRRLKRIPAIGSYLAGIISVAPYTVAIIPSLRVGDNRPLLGSLDDAELFAFAITTLLFGSVLGHVLFRPGALDESDDAGNAPAA